MSVNEVEGIIGAPARFSAKDPEATEGVSRWVTAHGWISDDAELTVLFDEEGKVVGRSLLPPARSSVAGDRSFEKSSEIPVALVLAINQFDSS